MDPFSILVAVRWADVDQNRHVRHSAYYDYGAHCRIQYFLKAGYNAQKFEALSLGPIIFKEECSFIKELKPDEQISINLLRGEATEDGSRWTLHHEIFNQKAEKAAHISLKGAWIDLKKRKLATPPKDLAESFFDLQKGDFFTYKKPF